MQGTYLSKWQGRWLGGERWEYACDLPRLKAAVPDMGFLYIKATQGATSIDPLFAIHRQKCVEARYPHGVFHYFTNRAAPSAQARHFWNVAGGGNHGYEILPSADVEDPDNVTDPVLADKLYGFLEESAALWGQRLVLYTRKTFWDPYIRKGATKPDPRFAGYKWWVAHYNQTIAAPWLPVDAPNWAIWQVGERAANVLPGLPAKTTIERLNPSLTLADISFPAPAPEKSLKALVYSFVTVQEVQPNLDLSIVYDNLSLMFDDLQKTGKVNLYIPLVKP